RRASLGLSATGCASAPSLAKPVAPEPWRAATDRLCQIKFGPRQPVSLAKPSKPIHEEKFAPFNDGSALGASNRGTAGGDWMVCPETSLKIVVCQVLYSRRGRRAGPAGRNLQVHLSVC